MRGQAVLFVAVLCACVSTVYGGDASQAEEGESRLWLVRVAKSAYLTEESGMDIWGCDASTCVVLVTEMGIQTLERSGTEVIEFLRSPEELGRRVQESFAKNEQRIASGDVWGREGAVTSFYDTFRTYGEIVAYCKDLATQYSTLVTPFTVGQTYEGRNIQGYKLSTGGSGKPEIYLEALQHAREWLAPPTLIYSMESILSGYAAGNDTYVSLLEQADWYIVPIVNVDGYLYTWSNATSARYWRKNRHEFDVNVYGVDLNRNWGPADTWCTAGSSHFVTSDTYCGESVFSEPESSAAATFMDGLDNLAAAIDFHCYGALLLWPWQYTYDHIAHADFTAYSTLGQSMVDAIEEVNGQVFVSEQGSDLYPHSGGLIDYAYDENNSVFAFTLELRGNDFVVPDAAIILSATEAVQAVIVMGNHVIENS